MGNTGMSGSGQQRPNSIAEQFKPLGEHITNRESAEGALNFVVDKCREAGLPRDQAERVIERSYS